MHSLAAHNTSDRHGQSSKHRAKPCADAMDSRIRRKPNPLWSKVATHTTGASAADVQKKCAGCDEEKQRSAHTLFVQTSLTMGKADEHYEQEADQVADTVMRMSKSGADEQFDDETAVQPQPLDSSIQRAESMGSNPAAASSVIRAVQAPGQGKSISPDIRDRTEPVLQADFSGVRAHSDEQAQQAARSIHAKAFTHKNNIYLGAGESDSDLQLMAHELTHVVQQGGQSNLVQRQDDGLSLRDMWRLGRRAFHTGVELIENEVPGGREAVGIARDLYNNPHPLISRGRHLADRITEESVFGAAGTESLRRITFDGSQVRVEGNPAFTATAVSGLQSHARDSRGIDYTNSLYQNQLNMGPIPEGEYYVIPSEVQSSARHGFNASAWGQFRVILHPTLLTYQHRVILRRGGGFYLHQDANRNGTAGCIGLLSASDNRNLLRRIQNSSSPIPVTVRYSNAPLEQRRDTPSVDCPTCVPAAANRSLTHPQASTATTITRVEGAWAAALAALDPQGGEIRVVGEALNRVRNNRGTRRAWHQLMRQILGYRFRGNAGRRMDYFCPARAIAYGGNYFDPSDYFTTGTWLIGHCFPTAQFEISFCRDASGDGLRGIVHAVWVIHDDLDLEPGQGRGPVYNTGARILTRIWHDTLGGRRTAPVYVEWEESRGFCLSPSGDLTFHPA